MARQLEFKDVYKWYPDNHIITLEELQHIIKAIRFLLVHKPNDALEYVTALNNNIEAVRRDLNNLVKDISKYIPDEIYDLDKKEKEHIQLAPGTQERVPGGN